MLNYVLLKWMQLLKIKNTILPIISKRHEVSQLLLNVSSLQQSSSFSYAYLDMLNALKGPQLYFIS